MFLSIITVVSLKEQCVNSSKYIIVKQIEWAKNQNINLIGSQGARGRKIYTTSIEENLFQPLNQQTREELIEGDGSELNGRTNHPAKIQALNSSSALGINIFDYWRNFSDISIIVSACGLTRSDNQITGKIQFEQKFSIDDRFQYAPNLDVVIYPDNPKTIKAYGVECKFTEPYSSRGHGGLDEKYLENQEIWQKLSNTKSLAQKISPIDSESIYLHTAQLIKHILGLNRKFGRGAFRLLYLWYDVLGEPGYRHNQEIERFSEVVRLDGIKFHSITYQELIINLAKHRAGHEMYIRYLTDRYL